MKFTPEHEQIRDTVKRFVINEINPHVPEWEKAQQYPAHQVMKRLGELGMLGLKYPEADGGANLDFSYSMVMAEALGYCDCGGVPMSIGVQTDMATPALARFGSDELRKQYLAPAIAGDMVGCIGVSEAGGGSDVAALKTFARKDGDDYVINGSKMWITNGLQADWCCLLANTSAEGGPHKNKSLIIVPMDSKGITKQKIHKIGMWSSDTAQLFFDNVRVPRRNLIGQEGTGFIYQMMQFQEERLWAAASNITGLGSHDRPDHRVHAPAPGVRQEHPRQPGGALPAGRAAHRGRGAARPHLPRRRVVHRAARTSPSWRRWPSSSAAGSRREVTDACLQYWGGMGFTWDNPVSQAFRDGRLVSIGGGADEVMLGIICKLEGTMPKGMH